VRKLEAFHEIICSMPYERLGYFGWPTVARMPDGTLVVGASGLRAGHICPWGKTVLLFSRNNGKTWSNPRVINDTPLDDRDCGIVSLGGKKILVTWFSLSYCIIPGRMTEVTPDLNMWRNDWKALYGAEALEDLDEICCPRHVYERAVKKWQNAWCRLSRDGGNNWGGLGSYSGKCAAWAGSTCGWHSAISWEKLEQGVSFFRDDRSIQQ